MKDILLNISNYIDEIRDIIDDMDEEIENYSEDECIKDLNNFIHKLKIDNLYSPEIKEFIENYIKFYND